MCLLQLKQSIPVSITIMSSLLQLKDCWDSNIAIETLLFMVPSIFLAVPIFLPEKENRVWHFKYIQRPPPPVAKQPPPPPGSNPDPNRVATSLDIDKLMASIATLSGRFNAVETGMGTHLQATEHSITKLTEEFQKERQDVITVVNEVKLRVDELASAVQDDRNNLGAAVSAAIDHRLSQLETPRLSPGGILDTLPLSVASASRGAIREEKYLLARRSLLIWPLQTGDLAGVQAFALKYLEMTQEEVELFQIANVIACRGAPGSKVVSEYLVEFMTISDRDSF